MHRANTTTVENPVRAIHDQLLTGFSYSEKKYLIDNLYPELRKALTHFVQEAKSCDQIKDVPEPAISEDNTTTESNGPTA